MEAEILELRAALAAPAQGAAVPDAELPDFDDLSEEEISLACAAGNLYRVDLMRAWDALRAPAAARDLPQR